MGSVVTMSRSPRSLSSYLGPPVPPLSLCSSPCWGSELDLVIGLSVPFHQRTYTFEFELRTSDSTYDPLQCILENRSRKIWPSMPLEKYRSFHFGGMFVEWSIGHTNQRRKLRNILVLAERKKPLFFSFSEKKLRLLP